MFSATNRHALNFMDATPRQAAADDAIAQFARDEFGVDFAQWCGNTGELLRDYGLPTLADKAVRGELAKQVAASSQAEVIAEEDGYFTLAIPVFNSEGDIIVLIRDFVSETPSEAMLDKAAQASGEERTRLAEWAENETPWLAPQLLRLAETGRKLQNSLREASQFRLEAEQASLTLSKTYEEISLLYAITQNLRISNSEQDLGDLALSWLHECLPAEAVVMVYLPEDEAGLMTGEKEQLRISMRGELDITAEQVLELVAHLGLNEASGPQVATLRNTSEDDWPVPSVRQLLIAPKVGDSTLFGWVAAINHTEQDEFGSTEASLLNTVCSILGTHCGNHELYRRQSSFLAAVVGSLTSAIDAKDPYTSGHSNRVARMAVRLGRELGCTEEEINTLYMGGLLHDIGKIGIDDNVLRKPGRLTDEEFDHIKQHPELGFKILEDIRELSDVLPIVLHHHEQWDGGGYPHGLRGSAIPWLARITAVSDSFDAMTSDRTYRKGMPIERVENIFREGSGTQWDADVIRAYFSCRDDILQIMNQDYTEHRIDLRAWSVARSS